MNLRDNSSAIAWQVFLGCNTAARLARELGIDKLTAAYTLRNAETAGKIKRVSRGVYGPRDKKEYHVVCCGVAADERWKYKQSLMGEEGTP